MLGTRLNEIVDKRGIKQKWLAQEAKVDPTTLSKLVRGKSFPTLDVAFRIANALDLCVDEIWYWERDPE